MAGTEEEIECRICRGNAEPRRPLFYPCKCSGSIKYTHEDCLVNWLNQAGSTRCELCHHPFRFEPLYQPDTPKLLPTQEFLLGIVSRVRRAVKTAARVALVFIVWLFLLPVCTCWTWYALFINSPGQLPTLVALRGVSGLITDAFRGCLLSAGIVFVFLGVSSLREYVRLLPDEDVAQHEGLELVEFENDVEGDIIAQPGQPNGFAVDSDDEAHENVANDLPIPAGNGPNRMQHPRTGLRRRHPNNHAAAGNRLPNGNEHGNEHGNAVLDRDQELDDPLIAEEDQVVADLDGLLRDTYEAITQDDDDRADIHDIDEDDETGTQGQDAHAFRDGTVLGRISDDEILPVDHGEPAAIEDLGDIDILHESDSEVLDDFRDDLEDRIPDHDIQAADEEQNENGGGFLGFFDLDPEEVPLEEVVGLRGHLRNLFDHAGTVLLTNAIFLGIFTFIPLCIGRFTLRFLSFKSFPMPVSLNLIDPWVQQAVKVLAETLASDTTRDKNFTEKAVSAFVNSSKVAEVAGKNSTVMKQISIEGLSATAAAFGSAVAEIRGSFSLVQPKGMDEPLISYADNFLVVLLGYGVISLGAVGYVIINSVVRSRYPRFDSPMTRQVARMLRYVATFVKILVLILFEFGIFPLGCGWWLDICTLGLVGGSFESRVAVCRSFPWMCTAGHWFLGIVFMVHISLFVSLLREVLRPELLWFLRNPDDPEFHPFRELVEKPLSRHARRMFLSVCIYVPLVIGIVFVPSQLCLMALPKVFPLRLDDFSHSLIDVPFGNLLLVPLISLVHHTRPGVLLHKILKVWINVVGNGLGIVHLVAKREEPEAFAVPPEGNIEGEARHENDVVEAGEGPLERMFGDEEDDAWVYEHSDVESEGAVPDVTGAEFSGVEMHENDDGDVRLKAATMFILAWTTLVLFECVLLSVPTVIGRGLMEAVGLPVHHDLHSFGVGFYVVLVSAELTSQLIKVLRTVDTATALRTALPRIAMGFKGFVLVVLWLGLVPLAAGILLELTITVPLRVPYNETPYLYLHQDWALGLLIIKLWNRVVLAGGFNADWRERIERAREGGVMGWGPNFPRTLQEVVLPVLAWTSVALSVPYVFSRGLLPLLGFSESVSCIVFRFIYVALATSYLLHVIMRSLCSAVRSLHDSIRDDKYLIGKQLYNFSDSSSLSRARSES